MAPAIPDRWLDYKPIGKRIEGTRFIAFKVPLREDITKTLDQKIRLDGKILLGMVPNLGMIIDLTNTYRYYDPNMFQRNGIKYKKLMIPGQIIPSKHLVNRFKQFVKQFIETNPDNDKLIGVHCTHGINRTGYFICNYMISEMTIEPNEAITRFDTARGHKIERNNYVDALQKLLDNNEQNASIDANEKATVNKRIYTPNPLYKERNDRIINWRIREENNSGHLTISNWRAREQNNSHRDRSRLRVDYYDAKTRYPYYHRGQSNYRSDTPGRNSAEQSCNIVYSRDNSVQNNERNKSSETILPIRRPRTAHLQRQHTYPHQNHPLDL